MSFINIYSSKLYGLIILVFIIVSFIIRFDNLSNHFTHVDDIGLAKTILETRKVDLTKNIFDEKNPTYNSAIKVTLRNNFEKESIIYDILNFSYPYLIGSLKNTYAPINSILINILLPENSSYNDTKFWGRISSLIFNFISILFFIILLFKIYENNKNLQIIFPLTLISFSYEHIIVANLMHNYSMSAFCTIIFLYLINKNFNSPKKNFKNILINSFIFSLCMYLHYQTLFLIFSMLCYDFFIYFKFILLKKKFLSKFLIELFYKYLLICFFIFPLVVWLFLRNFDTFSWNAGPNNEFLFDINLFKKDYFYLFSFFIKNSILTFSRMISFTSEINLNKYFLDYLIFILIISGTLLGFKLKNSKIKNLTLFSVFFILLSFVFIFFSKIAFSPTRHSIIYLPIVILLINNNILFIFEKIKGQKLETLFLYNYLILIAFITISFFENYNKEKENRLDQFNEHKFVELVDKYNIDAIVNYDWTFNTLLMPSVANKVNHKTIYFIPLISDSYNDGIINTYNLDNLNLDNQNIVALVSSVGPIPNSPYFNKLKNKYPIKDYDEYYKELKIFFDTKFKDWENIYVYENIIDKEIEFSSLTNNTPNSIFIYIYRKI